LGKETLGNNKAFLHREIKSRNVGRPPKNWAYESLPDKLLASA